MRLPTRLLHFFFFLILSPSLFAGSAEAFIEGKTESGRTEVEIEVGDIVGQIRKVKLTVDGKSYEMKDSESTSQTVIRDGENGVYFLVFETPEQKFTLWMIPKTEKVKEETAGSYRSTFAAVIEATDPRKSNKFTFTPRITIGCTLDYSI